MPTNKGPTSPRDVAIMGVGATMLSCNQASMRQLGSVRRVRLEFEQGNPVLIPDRDGWAVTHHTSTHQYTGFIKAPAILKAAQAVLPEGSKWEFRWQGKRLVGKPWSPEDKKRPDYIRIPRPEFEELRRLAEIGRQREAMTG